MFVNHLHNVEHSPPIAGETTETRLSNIYIILHVCNGDICNKKHPENTVVPMKMFYTFFFICINIVLWNSIQNNDDDNNNIPFHRH